MITPQQWDHLQHSAGWAPLEDRAWIRIAGPDRLSFLHSFCTQDVKQLPTGQVTESFILNEKGKVLAWVLMLSVEEELWLTCHDRAVAGRLIAHLDKYLIREDVTLEDVSDTWSSWFLTGAECQSVLAGWVGNPQVPAHGQLLPVGDALPGGWLAAAEVAGPGYLMTAAGSSRDAAQEWLRQSGIELVSTESAEGWRIESGTPAQGQDISDANLPQELERDDLAISFNKGCYLGQETVARLDAMGRTQWVFCRLAFDDASLQAGQEIEIDGKVVVRITSAGAGPSDSSWIGLGFVRRGHHQPGTEVGPVRVRETRETGQA